MSPKPNDFLGDSEGLRATDLTARPGDFPLGSAQSRAAARAEYERRQLLEQQNATVVFGTGLPFRSEDPPVIEPPDSVAYYGAPDGSIVQVIRRFWESDDRHGLTISIDQTWPDGSVYQGDCRMDSLAKIERLPLRMEP